LSVGKETRARIIQPPGAQPEGGAARFERTSHRVRCRRSLCDAVVLEHEQNRHVPNGGQVHAFVQQTFAGGPVTDDRRHDPGAAAQFTRQRLTHAYRRHTRLYAIAVEMPVRQMLAAAHAAAGTAFPAHNLRN